MRKCPKCGRDGVKDTVTVCRYCQQPIPTAEESAAMALTSLAPARPTRVLTADERKLILARAIQTQVGFQMRIESQSDFQTVLVFGQRPNHLLHFFIGLFTLGLWWLVWLLLALSSKEQRRMLTADEYGTLTSTDY